MEQPGNPGGSGRTATPGAGVTSRPSFLRTPAASLNRRIIAVLIVALVVGAGLFFGLRALVARQPPGLPPGTQVNLPFPVQHLVIVFMENFNLTTVLKNGSYERYLSHEYAFAGQYYGVSKSHNSTAEYEYAAAGTSGYRDARSVANLLMKNGESWAEFEESMPSACYLPQPAGLRTNSAANWSLGYDNEHNPFLRFSYVGDNASLCSQSVLNLSAWNADVSSGHLPNYAFVAPNTTHDCHNSTVTTCDAWLRGWLSPMVNSSLFDHTAFVITYDDGNATHDFTGARGSVGGGQVFFVLVSPYSRQHYTSTLSYNHFNLLTTTEWLLGLGRLNTLTDDWNTTWPMTDLFDFGPDFNLTGTVTASGHPVPGAVVSGAGYSVTTGADGRYALLLPSGVYSFGATNATGCGAPQQTVTISGAAATLNFAMTCPV